MIPMLNSEKKAARNEAQPTRVLIVDDEPFNLDLLEQELSGLGLEITSASDGKKALEQVRAASPDMIFLDLMMPVMDGFAVLEALQADEALRNIPVVIVSAADDLANVVRGIEMGAVDFLPKPFEPAILKARLNAGLEKKRLHDLEFRYRQSLERELEIGREIQAGFLPAELPAVKGWSIQAHFKAAREVAGDFYDVFEVGKDKIGLLLGDVTDKGVGSAMYMALYRTLLRSSMLADTFSEDLEEVNCATPELCLLEAVKLANRYIYKLHHSAMLATIFFAILNTETGDLCYVNAGHDPPCLLRGNQIHLEIPATGPVVGAIEEAVYRIETLTLEPGDCLVLYSDGIPDAQDEDGERFGVDRLRALLQGNERSPDGLFEYVLSALEEHIGTSAPYDDVTLMIVSRI